MNYDNLKKHLTKYGKTDTWLNLAIQFDVLPFSSNKQRADKVRKIYTRQINKKTEFVAKASTAKSFTKIEPYLKGNLNNVLVIGDIHEPFSLDSYLQFCRDNQERFDCGTVVFIGDVIDNHFSSFHDADADGMSAGMELDAAIQRLQKWYYTFPNAIVTIGNHDRIIARKLYSGSLSQRWLKPINEVLNVPNWTFVEEFVYNNVLYNHGEGGTAKMKARNEMISTVQGHLHSEAYVEFISGVGGTRFAMQVGCGINFNAYAFNYAQRGKKPIISCGVILNGKQPILLHHG